MRLPIQTRLHASACLKKAVVNSEEITSTRNHTLGVTQLVRNCCLTNKICLERYKMVFLKEYFSLDMAVLKLA